MRINQIKEDGRCEECGLSHSHRWSKDEKIFELEFGIEHIRTLQLCTSCLNTLADKIEENITND